MLTPLFIYVVLPLAGLLGWLSLMQRMRARGVVKAPWLSYFLLFFNSGGSLLVSLTGFYWEWSGMASVGVYYLLLFSPLGAAVAALLLWRRRRLSGFHTWALRLHAGYLSLILLTWLVLAYSALGVRFAFGHR